MLKSMLVKKIFKPGIGLAGSTATSQSEAMLLSKSWLTHWGWVTHICVSELTIIVSENGLSPGRRQAIIWNNAGLLLIQPLGTNVGEISIGIQTFSFKKMHLNMSSAKWRPFCLGLNVLTNMYECINIRWHGKVLTPGVEGSGVVESNCRGEVSGRNPRF